jgi:two-component system, sensor histidine kinase ChiS
VASYTGSMSNVRTALLTVLTVLLLCAVDATAASQRPMAVQGRIDLDASQPMAIALRGQWGFAWHRFVAPDWERLPTTALAPVPSSWNDIGADGKPPGPNGWGSYVLLVNCAAGQSLAVEAIGQRTASRLYVNGVLVGAHGQPGRTAESNYAAVYRRIPISRQFACPLRITMHVANFDHRAGGFVRPLMAGPADALERHREAFLVYDAVLLSAYLLTGVVALIFFAVRRQERATLAFGLFCIAMAVYTDMIGERLFLRLLASQPSWFAYMRVEYLSWIASMGLYFVTLRGLFPAEIHRRAVHAVVGTLAVAAVAVLALPPGIYSYVALPGQAIAVVVALYVVAAMLRAQRRAPVDARVLLAGFFAVLVTLAIDLLLIDAPGPDRKFAPIGFAFFLLSPAVVIARRLSHALNAEERNRTLEENARLRDDVERMSRHDLKTPLNSILGVARLLRDDPTLTAGQRELVGVAQRAGFRMLEMVNLSLGLFKMETGTYEFHPAAVDLRELAARVLVDLHSYADANLTGLVLEDGEPGAAYVRAEELLCYSIVANLVKNAIEAAGPGGRVTVVVEPGEPVRLSVRNPGGVAPEIVPRFFEKYVSGKTGGTGLGTYSARLMARVQGGNLELRSGPEHGTVLTLSLPAWRDSDPLSSVVPEGDARVAPVATDLPVQSVLLVDDDEPTLMITRQLLPNPPFQVDTAINGRAAVEAMARRWPDYLLVDMEMPLMNGLETVAWVRRQEREQGRPRCKVIMMSANDDQQARARAATHGVDRYLPKPVNREELLAIMLQLGDATGPQPARMPGKTGSEPAAAGPTTDEIALGEAGWIEAFPQFLQSQHRNAEAMAQALHAGERRTVQFLAHRSIGSLSLMGLHEAARHCRLIEQGAAAAPIAELEQRIGELLECLRQVRNQCA